MRRTLVRGLTRTSSMPGGRRISQAGMRAVFNQVAGKWDIIRQDPIYIEACMEALERAERSAREGNGKWPPDSMLDVGCGTGLATSELCRRFPGALVHGVDISPEMISYARKRKLPAVFAVADSTVGEFPAQTYDLIISLDGIFSASVLADHLNPGGTILIVYSRGGAIPVSRKPVHLISAFENEGLTATAWTGDAWLVLASKPA